MSNIKEKDAESVVFLGPLSHREERLDNIINAQMSSQWSEDTEAKYLESVRARATSKVRAMLLQAKKRSDEIIQQAETDAIEIKNKADAAYAELLEAQQKAQMAYDNAAELATQNATETMREELSQNQHSLAESTTVVLLSIHQQLQNIYDAWKEELRTLTLEAIQVGTGWVADSHKEEILGSMLDNCVRKLIEKKDYVVRVHPSDGALVTQVLERSREKSWTMESSTDLEPGSLEVESKHAMVKDSNQERRKFVEEILENLVLPPSQAEEVAIQNVTDTLMNEIQQNPLLAKASSEQNQEYDKNAQGEFPQESAGQIPNDNQSPEYPEADQNAEYAQDTNNIQNQDLTEQNQEQSANDIADMGGIGGMENVDDPTAVFDMPNTDMTSNEIEPQALDEPAPQQNPLQDNAQEINAGSNVNPSAEAENMVDEFLGDLNEEPSAMQEMAEAPATEQDSSTSLPPDLADDLLAEMGFGSAEANK